MPKITVGQENRANPEMRDDTQRSAQPVMANRAGGTTAPSPTMAGVDPKVVNRAAGAATDPDGPTGRLATWLAATTLDDVPLVFGSGPSICCSMASGAPWWGRSCRSLVSGWRV